MQNTLTSAPRAVGGLRDALDEQPGADGGAAVPAAISFPMERPAYPHVRRVGQRLVAERLLVARCRQCPDYGVTAIQWGLIGRVLGLY